MLFWNPVCIRSENAGEAVRIVCRERRCFADGKIGARRSEEVAPEMASDCGTHAKVTRNVDVDVLLEILKRTEGGIVGKLDLRSGNVVST